MRMKNLLLLILLASCATPIRERPTHSPTAPSVALPSTTQGNVSGAVEGKSLKFVGTNLSANHVKAISKIEAHANTDAFEKFFLVRYTRLSHTDKTPGQAIKLFREQMGQGDEIRIVYDTPWYKSSAIGAWNGSVITQNAQWNHLPVNRRAGHLLHEASHKYGWRHQGNYQDRYENNISFPYAVGYAFESYLNELDYALALEN